MPTLFVKYPPIENLYNVMEDEGYLNECREIPGWIVTEKIDGCNIALVVSEEGIQTVSRNGIFLDGSDELYAAAESLKWLHPHLLKIKKELGGLPFIIYGEFYGPKIQNRIYYGENREIRFFDLFIPVSETQGRFLPWWRLRKMIFFAGLDTEKHLVPVLQECDTFDEAREFANNLISTLTDTEHQSKMEGVVIRPMNVNDHKYVIKNKNSEFAEARNFGGPKRAENVEVARSVFLDYLTENRMYGIISKMGLPKSRSDVGSYIQAFMRDAINDFLREKTKMYEDPFMSDVDRKAILKTPKSVFPLFKKVARAAGCKIDF